MNDGKEEDTQATGYRDCPKRLEIDRIAPPPKLVIIRITFHIEGQR